MWYSRALEAAAAPGSSFRAEVGALRLQLATAVVPTIYASRSQALNVRRNYTKNLKSLIQPDHPSLSSSASGAVTEASALVEEPANERRSLSLAMRIDEPLTSTGCGALGYERNCAEVFGLVHVVDLQWTNPLRLPKYDSSCVYGCLISKQVLLNLHGAQRRSHPATPSDGLLACFSCPALHGTFSFATIARTFAIFFYSFVDTTAPRAAAAAAASGTVLSTSSPSPAAHWLLFEFLLPSFRGTSHPGRNHWPRVVSLQ